MYAHKILEGRQYTAPEGCLSEKSTRRSPKKSITTDKKQKLLQQLLWAEEAKCRAPHGACPADRPPNKIIRHTFLPLQDIFNFTIFNYIYAYI